MKCPMLGTQKTRRQLGATLIEVLVTMFVVAVALLGTAGLQIASTRYQQTTYRGSVDS
jgi:type IV pilus assembly protein PilV